MTKSIIVENLSKKFTIHHEGAERVQQATLREAVTSRLLGVFKRDQQQSSSEVFWALRDINFEVEQGERLAIVGRNGAGKSTLLKILSRVMSPSEGRIQITGKLSSLLEVGTGFHPDLTGRENIYLNGAILGMSHAEVRRKFDAIVDFAEIEKFLDTPVKRYSSGMYVRLAFAVSAFLEPDIVVLDEVLSVGDAAFQRKSYDKMRELAAEGRTVLFVSHSMGAVKELCETAILIEHGRIKEKTKVAQAVGDYMRHAVRVQGANFPLITEQVDLLGIQLAQGGQRTSTFTLDGDAPIEVTLIFHTHLPLQNFRMGFYIKTILGETVTRALLADWNPEMEAIATGSYSLKATVPAKFLVAGDYVLEVHSSEFAVRDFFGSNALQPFRVTQPRTFNVQHEREQPFGYTYLNAGWRLDRLPN